ncbi:hypothetical protein IscW_ISCW015990 [Ixodes scapularis]|uniref:Uncharacterized protein n=1 Tax=Ixodes scapularis TaxID=6945 RepID=B7P720_IXOSC|nr:hypothetical protein IscW_ISCW015990 [Ixodes scapularis]|eukprot:XP_002409475.1 hypothetical protein IscW_ISCW015990 [Ixodes scapularis]
MQESLVVALQQLFPRATTGPPAHPDTTQGSTSAGHAPTLGGYEANPAAQAAAFGQPLTQPPFQATFNPSQPFPPPTPVDVPVYAQAATKQRIFTVHDLPTRRDLGEAFIHVQNANRSSQLLSRRNIIELQLLEAFLEVWDSYPPPAPQSRLRVFDRVRLLYHVTTSGWNAALDGYADPSASYLLGPPARRAEQPQRATSPPRPRKNPGRQSRKDNPRKTNPKEDNTSNPDTSPSSSKSPMTQTRTKLRQTASCGTSRHTSPPSPLKRASLDNPLTTTKKTRTSPRKRIQDNRQDDKPDHPTLQSGHQDSPQRRLGKDELNIRLLSSM